jgi:hypothetical protein
MLLSQHLTILSLHNSPRISVHEYEFITEFHAVTSILAVLLLLTFLLTGMDRANPDALQ